ncbi:GNAT family N-acetyltransferase [Streptomyces sp. ISL-36]|uniref:GNAT family N-acetyltransferase n=1 Tax=Streptomyces sp. ISL-36 TaxID=2819182 RepID=UPI001BEA6518|nr:GNAT family protein [Streptomyces sp. ISL-36]MBT2445386.1 GNAT family N-acetyltransferase [Streptomyces sp. ISL-36]
MANPPATPMDTAPVHPEYPVRTKRLHLRPVRADDLEAVHAHRSLPEVALYLPHEPHTREVTAQTLERLIGGESLATPGDWLGLAVETEPGRVVGEVFLRRDDREPATGEVGFAFHPDVWGTGIATEAVTAALDIAFDSFGWHRVYGVCDVQNVASAALMRRIGMRHESVMRQNSYLKNAWCNDSQFAVLATEWRRTAPRSAEERAVDAVSATFFSAFSRSGGEPVSLAAARSVLAPDAVIERVDGDGRVERMGVEEFLASRHGLLNVAELTDFDEIEVSWTTVITAGRALRSSLCFRRGVRDGAPFTGWGRTTFQLGTGSGGWLVESATWTDEPDM